MQVSVESISDLKRSMKVVVPKDVVDEAIGGRLAELSKSVRLDGFRPGKVPMRVIKSQFGAQVRGEVQAKLTEKTFFEAITQESLKPAGMPKITHDDEQTEGFAYSAEFEVYPEVKVADVSELKVEKVIAEITVADVDDMVERLRTQRATWQEVEREAQEKDKVTIDFEGEVNEEPISEELITDYPVTLGSGTMIPGFEEQLAGAKAGASLEFETTFPEDYQEAKFAGQTGKFKVEVKKVEEPQLPEVDEDFMKSFGAEVESEEAFRADLRKNMELELKRAQEASVKQNVIEALLENNEVQLPEALVDSEVAQLIKQMQDNMQQQSGGQQAMPDIPRELVEEQAQKRVKLGLLMSEIVQQNKLSADGERVRAKIDEFAQTYHSPEEVVNWYYSNPQELQKVESAVLEDQLVDWILEQAQVETVESSFQAVMNPGKK